MRGKRVKALRLASEGMGVKLSKKGFRRLKKTYNRNRKLDAVSCVRKLVLDDVRRSRLSKMRK